MMPAWKASGPNLLNADLGTHLRAFCDLAIYHSSNCRIFWSLRLGIMQRYVVGIYSKSQSIDKKFLFEESKCPNLTPVSKHEGRCTHCEIELNHSQDIT